MNSQEQLNFYLHTEQFQKTLLRDDNFLEALSGLLLMNALTSENKDEIENLFRHKSRIDATNVLLSLLAKQSYKDLSLILDKFDESKNTLKENIKDNQTGWSNLLINLKEHWKKTTSSIELLSYGDVNKMDTLKAGNSIELMSNNLNNNMESILFSKFYTIFEKQWNKILIIGEPFIGKTTQITYLLNSWANDLWLKSNNKLVLYINLQKVYSKDDLFDTILKQNFQNNVYISKKILKYIFQERYEDVILFIDGANELSFIGNLYKILENCKYFIKTIVWSQNSNAKDINNSFDLIFEITGLGLSQIEKFLNNCNLNVENLDGFLQDIKRFDLVLKMCRVPLLLLLIFSVWQEDKDFYRRNLSEIYESIITHIQCKAGIPTENFLQNMSVIFSLSFNFLHASNISLNIEKYERKELVSLLKYFANVSKPNIESKILNVQFLHSSFKSFFAARHLTNNYFMNNRLNIERAHFENLLAKAKNLDLYIMMQFIRQSSVDLYSELLLISRKIQQFNETDNEINSFMLQGMGNDENLFITNKRLNNTILSIFFENFGQNIVNIHLNNIFVDLSYFINILSKYGKNLKEFEIIFSNYKQIYELDSELWSKILYMFVSTKLKFFTFKNIVRKYEDDNSYLKNELSNPKREVLIDDEFLEGLSKEINLPLESICLIGCKVSELQSNSLGELLSYCTNIKSMDLSFSLIKGSGFKSIIRGLKHSKDQLRNLNFYKTSMNGTQAAVLGEVLSKCSNVQTVSLGKNDQLQSGFTAICHALHNSVKTLKYLDIKFCDLLNEQTEGLKELLSYCTELEYFNISWNKNIFLNFKDLISSLTESSSKLKTLDFSYCNLTEIEGMSIGELVEKCSNLKHLSVASNRNLYCSFGQILNGLKASTETISVLNFSACHLTESQIATLGQFLGTSPNITSLDISWNQRIGLSFIEIIDGLKTSSQNIRKLNFCGCNLNLCQAMNLATLLANCKYIEHLDISFSRNMQQGLVNIFESLHASAESLKYLNLRNCKMNKNQNKALQIFISICPNKCGDEDKIYTR